MAPLVLALALRQSADPYVRSRVQVGDPEAHCLFWSVPTVRWQLSSPGNTASTDAEKQKEFEAIRRSFQSWQDIFVSCGNLRIEERPMVDDRKVGYEMKGENRNLVLFRSVNCTDRAPASDPCWSEDTCGNVYDCWDGDSHTIGLTLTTYDEKSGIIYDSDIQLNASGFDFTTADGSVGTDVQNTMTHEIGHLLGLDHTQAFGSTMYPRAPPGETSKRVVDSGSARFVCEVYPKDQPSQSCVTPAVTTLDNAASLGPPAVGCTSSGAAAWLPALVGWAALLRRRRRGGSRP
ncbi:MAG TPA: myxosortase-dependent metalloprotease, MXAN_2677/MXAN_2678 family [Myxococcaceae bacterium]|nr:myxosortase-dependent metalloprotease, MXAN_2677/MXAN_2678 family [Myxococcaceae bacterium]